jgi:hypothetical protein
MTLAPKSIAIVLGLLIAMPITAWQKRATSTCDHDFIQGQLSRRPQPALSWPSRFIGFLTTPFKRMGISGWTKTHCHATATGTLVRNAQHSTDGFWTIDVELEQLVVEGEALNVTERYIRIEVERGTSAHKICAQTKLLKGERIQVEGPVMIDRDGPFLEIHPTELVRK